MLSDSAQAAFESIKDSVMANHGGHSLNLWLVVSMWSFMRNTSDGISRFSDKRIAEN
jgi:hypothetical protein